MGRANVIALIILVLLAVLGLALKGNWEALILMAMLASPVIVIGTVVYFLLNRIRARK